MTDVFQFMLPATSCDLAFTVGVTIETLGTSRLIASRSSTVSVLVPVSPVPLRTPPTFCAPALTKSRLVPMLSICACTEADAPWPMLTIAITAETPMMMPSMVRAARILLRTRARKATRMIIKRFIVISDCRLSIPIYSSSSSSSITGRFFNSSAASRWFFDLIVRS